MIENAVIVQIMLKMNFILYWFVQNITTIDSVFLRSITEKSFLIQRFLQNCEILGCFFYLKNKTKKLSTRYRLIRFRCIHVRYLSFLM